MVEKNTKECKFGKAEPVILWVHLDMFKAEYNFSFFFNAIIISI